MIQISNKETEAIYYGDKEVEAIYLGEEKVWGKEEEKKGIHLVGAFKGNNSNDWYVWINGTKYILDNPFDFTLNEEVEWEYGESMNDQKCRFSYSLESINGGAVFGLKDTSYMFTRNPNTNETSLNSLDLSGWDMSEATNAYGMFYSCTRLTEIKGIENWDVSNLENISNCFYQLSNLRGSLDLSKWKTDSLKNMTFLFTNCRYLESINLGGWNIMGVDSAAAIFQGCTALHTVNLGGWNYENCKNTSSFYNCTSLTTVIGPIYNIPLSLSLQYSPLTVDSAMVFINGLKDGVTGQTITFSTTTYNSLTPEQIAIATAKGWNVAKA